MVAFLSGLFLGPGARAAERLPIEDFARESEMDQLSLSPNGKYVAFLRLSEGRMMVFVNSLDENKRWAIDPGTAAFANDALEEVEFYTWVSDKRLLLGTAVWETQYGVVAVNFDGSGVMPISGYETIKPGSLHSPATFVRQVLATGFEQDPVLLMVDDHFYAPGSSVYPDVVKVDTETGFISKEVKNSGNIVAWSADHRGVVRAGLVSQGNFFGMVYRDTEIDPWRVVLPPEDNVGYLQLLGYDAGRGRFIVASLNQNRRWAPYEVDPSTGKLGDPILSNPSYDIAEVRGSFRIDGLSLSGPIFSSNHHLVGYRYFTEVPRVKWFDPEFASYQGKMDQSVPDTVNIPTHVSRDGKRILWFCFSDRDPGSYVLSDLETNKLRFLGKRMSGINPAKMSPMKPIKYTARDDVVIHGYLSVPVNHEAKNLPLIVLPHGGPWERDTWGFDPLVQLLVNRGYGVLQMNYRGSSGYGEALFEKGQREIGGKIQDDIEDGTRWAIASGIADPKRVAIVGASYGGYSALFALGQTPALYRCGVSIAGVTDWLDIFRRWRHDSDYERANEFWREQIGDPEKDIERLRAVSPVNFAEKITAPVLLIQGKEDRIVPKQQANLMIAALEKAGRKPEKLFLSKVGHSYGHQKERTMLYKRVVEFLEKNLGPGVE